VTREQIIHTMTRKKESTSDYHSDTVSKQMGIACSFGTKRRGQEAPDLTRMSAEPRVRSQRQYISNLDTTGAQALERLGMASCFYTSMEDKDNLR
jgi:hypothetical protein